MVKFCQGYNGSLVGLDGSFHLPGFNFVETCFGLDVRNVAKLLEISRMLCGPSLILRYRVGTLIIFGSYDSGYFEEYVVFR